MAKFERLEPRSGDMPVFDGHEDIEDEGDEGSRLPLLIVIALLVLAAFAGVVWLAYTQGVERGRADAPRVIESQEGPASSSVAKEYQQPAPANEQAENNEVAPPPATPATPAPAPAPVAKAPTPAPAPVAKASVPTPVSHAKAVTAASEPKPVPSVRPAPPKIAAATPARSPAVPATPKLAAVKATKSAAAPLAESPPPAPVAKAAPSEAPKPSAKATHAPAALAEQAPEAVAPPAPEAPPAAAATPAPAPVQTSPPAASATAAAGKGYLLQIGAYKSQAEADAAWRTFQATHPAAAGYGSDVKKADLGAKGIWYRLRLGAFADKDAAGAVCTKLKAEGASCFLAR